MSSELPINHSVGRSSEYCDEGGNWSTQRKPSKLNPRTMIVEEGGVIDYPSRPAWLTKEYSKRFFPDGHSSNYQPCPTGLSLSENTGSCVAYLCKLYCIFPKYSSIQIISTPYHRVTWSNGSLYLHLLQVAFPKR